MLFVQKLQRQRAVKKIMAEFNMVSTKNILSEDGFMERSGMEHSVTLLTVCDDSFVRESNIFNINLLPMANETLKRAPNQHRVKLLPIADTTLKRATKRYTNGDIIPLRVVFKGENGEEVVATKEVREWTMVLPFGGGNDIPRRRPLDISWTKKQF